MSTELDDVALRFYDKISPVIGGKKHSLAAPQLDPKERLRRRQAWRNQRHLYKRNCSLTGKPVISIYPEGVPFPVYHPAAWWGDAWNAHSYGRGVNFSKTVFEQVAQLQNDVPRISLIQLGEMLNSDFTNDVMRLKDCYLVFDGEEGRNCYYGETFVRINDCLDFLELLRSELCYECIACHDCYRLFFSHNCFQCSESWFLRDCRGCRNCFGCANLRQKEYMLFNRQCSKEEYEGFIDTFTRKEAAGCTSWELIDKARDKALQVWQKEPVKYMRGVQNENVTGDYVSYSKDSQSCFNCKELRDCRYCTNLDMGAKDCYDIDVWGNDIELCCECVCVGEHVREALGCLYVSHAAERIYYSQFCSRGVQNLFACIGLSKASHCILNKSYTQHEYEKLASKLCSHMQETGEWGEFFPAELSPFAYNETVAHEYFPLTEEQAKEKGLGWRQNVDQPQEDTSPNASADDNPLQLNEKTVLLRCEESKRLFKIQASELALYCKQGLPLPRYHPDIRHRQRMALRNPRSLWERTCPKSGKALLSSYPPSTTQEVLSEKAYLEAVK